MDGRKAGIKIGDEFMNRDEQLYKTMDWALAMYEETGDPAFKIHFEKAKELLNELEGA